MQNCEFLTRGLFTDCIKFAQGEGDLRLAALVHAASGSDHIRDLLRHCAHEDVKNENFSLKEKKVFDFISKMVDVFSRDFRRTIAILSGEFIVKDKNLVDQNRSILWQMAFALHLW